MTINILFTDNKILHIINPVFDYDTAKYYDIRIRCSDGENTVYSNFQVDIVMNTPPSYNAGSGYLPGEKPSFKRIPL